MYTYKQWLKFGLDYALFYESSLYPMGTSGIDYTRIEGNVYLAAVVAKIVDEKFPEDLLKNSLYSRFGLEKLDVKKVKENFDSIKIHEQFRKLYYNLKEKYYNNAIIAYPFLNYLLYYKKEAVSHYKSNKAYLKMYDKDKYVVYFNDYLYTYARLESATLHCDIAQLNSEERTSLSTIFSCVSQFIKFDLKS